MFLVHWKGQTPEEATWEKYEDLWQFKDKVQEFLQRCVAVVASLGGGDCDVSPLFQPKTQQLVGQPVPIGPMLAAAQAAQQQAVSSPGFPRDLEGLA